MIRTSTVFLTCLIAPLAANPRTNIPLSDFELEQLPSEDDFFPAEGSYNSDLDDWILRPNNSNPEQTFGWLAGPSLNVDRAELPEIQGNVAGMTVSFSFNQDYQGFAPELRLRLNTEDFDDYAISAVTTNKFSALREQGEGTATVVFDRNKLTSDTNIRLFIDLLSAAEPGEVDPEFFVRVEKVEWYVSTAGSSFSRDQLISAAWIDDDEDARIYFDGETRRIRESVDSIAHDDAYVLVLDNERLLMYSSFDDFDDFEVGTNVIAAGLWNHIVVYAQNDGDVFSYNYLTGEYTELNAEDYENVLASTGGDGSVILLEVNSDARARLFQADVIGGDDELDRIVDDFDVRFWGTRDIGIGTVSDDKKITSSNLWTLTN